MTVFKIMKCTTKIKVIGLIILCMLSGCEAYIGEEGSVLEQAAGKPMDSVLVVLFVGRNPQDSVYTNDQGVYNVQSLVGTVFGIPDYTITFSKSGYQPKSILILSAHQDLLQPREVILTPHESNP